MNKNKWRIIMQVLDNVVSLFPFILMIAVSIGGIIFSYFQNQKIDEDEKKRN